MAEYFYVDDEEADSIRYAEKQYWSNSLEGD